MLQSSVEKKYDIPFATGYSLQEYHSAEMGLLEAAKANFDYWYIDASLDGEAPDQWSLQRIDNLLFLIEHHKVKPIFHGNYKVPLASDVPDMRRAAVSYVKREINLASELGGAPVIIHGGAIVEPRLIEKAKRRALNGYLESIEILSEYAAKNNVELYLENLSNYKNYWPFHYVFTHVEEFEYILSRVENVKFFLDVGHANICDGNPVEMIRQFHDRIVGMSFSNNNGVKDQHLRLDHGTVDYRSIIMEILNCNWQGIIGFETRGRYGQSSVDDLRQLYQSVAVKRAG